MSGVAAPGPHWIDHETLDCGHVQLHAIYDARTAELQSTESRFVLGKSPQMVDWYRERFASRPPRRVLEVGIFKGGSVVLFEELWRPEKLIAVDITEQRVTALDAYVQRTGAAGRVRAFYGVDQADAEALGRILDQECGGETLDLVVDDGCHYLDETRATLEAVFPRLAPGAQYIIEDWAWAHWPGVWQEEGGPWRALPSTTMLVLELVILSASRPDLIASLEVDTDLLVVHKGASAPVGEPLDLAAAALTAGRFYFETPGRSEVAGGRPAGAPPTALLPADPRDGLSGLEAARRDAELAAAAVRTIEASRSWRLTAPLRALAARARRRHQSS
jgi:SAM-dependent methyltransferase